MTRVFRLPTILVLILGSYLGAAQSPQESRKTLPLARVTAPLKSARISLDESSLIRTLRSEDKRLATSAALTLGILGEGRSPRKALHGVIGDQDELLAITSMYALWLLGDNSWTDEGAKRLPLLSDNRHQLLLAGHLARAGNTKGWPFLLNAIRGEKWAPLALENVSVFVGKRDGHGQVIDVEGDLEKIQKELSPSVAAMVQDSLRRLKKAQK
jgi:hypothetical protein